MNSTHSSKTKILQFSLLSIFLLCFFGVSVPQVSAVACTVAIGSDPSPGFTFDVTVSSGSSLSGYTLRDETGKIVTTFDSSFDGSDKRLYGSSSPVGTSIVYIVYDTAGNKACQSAPVTMKAKTGVLTPGAGAPTVMPAGQTVTSKFLYEVNPLTITGNSNPFINYAKGFLNVWQFDTPGGFLSAALPYLFSLAGLILFIMILWGGFEMLYGAADTKAQEAGKQRITAALIGFTLLFVSYWIAQIVGYIFGVNILG